MRFITDDLPIDQAQQRYAKRRRELARRIGQPMLVFSVDQGPGGANPWAYAHTPIYQDPLFLFLTGITQYPAALWLTPDGGEILFLPSKNKKEEFWTGERLGYGDEQVIKQAQQETGISEIQSLDLLWDPQNSPLSKSTKIGLFWNEAKEGPPLQDSHWVQKSKLSTVFPALHHHNIRSEVWATRFPHDEQDLTLFKTAARLSAEAFAEASQAISSCATEHALAARLEGAIMSRSSFGRSFPTILAGGENAAILHYTDNDQPLRPGELVLIDFGVRWHSLHSDISRTLPINGKFDPLQALLYTIVLDTQAVVEDAVKAGVTIAQLNTLCWTTMKSLLKTRFQQKGGKMHLAYTEQPHNVGHLLGVQVHDGDPFREYRDTPLIEGMVITNEPGLYGEFEMVIDGVRYRHHLGIRIEDDLWVTDKGCINLTKDCPKTIAEIERLKQSC